MTIRDSQKKRVYKAERAVFLANPTRRFNTLEQCVDFAVKVLKKRAIRNRYDDVIGDKTVTVAFRRGRFSYGWYSGIELSKYGRCEWIILHELAHVIQQRWERKNREHTAHHCWLFCKIYLDLVRYVLGKEAADALKASFRKNKVKYKTPKLAARRKNFY